VFLPKATERKEAANKKKNKRRAILLSRCIKPTVAKDILQLKPRLNGRKERVLH